MSAPSPSTQAWQYPQAANVSQPQAMYGVDLDMANQWQAAQLSNTPPSSTVGTEHWMCRTPFAAEQRPCSVVMVAVVPQSNLAANCVLGNHGDIATLGPYPMISLPGHGCENGGTVTSWPMHSGDLANMQPLYNVQPAMQSMPYLPICASPPVSHEGSAVPMTTAVPKLSLSELTCSNAAPTAERHYLTAAMEELAMCTPEATPRGTPELATELDTTRFDLMLASTLLKHDCVDTFSERLDDIDEKDDVCWDFDINAALLIRAQRDGNEYASSDTSTAVSRSSRHRRGRRLAKTKAKSSSMAILEPPLQDDLVVTEEMKAELLKQMEAGGNQMREAVSSLLGSALRMSLEPFGCRVMQTALELASTSMKEALVAELHGCVRLLVSSPHGNFVIQKVIEVFPVHSASFVAEELAMVAVDVAQHRFGCRVFSRLIEHHLESNVAYPAANDLVDELLVEVDQLMRHNFARHVVELILEHGSSSHKKRIADGIRTNAFYYAKNRCASYVLEKALMFCSDADKEAIASELLVDADKFLQLAVHECGMHALKAVVQSRTEYAQKAKALLLANADSVNTSKFGKRLLEEM